MSYNNINSTKSISSSHSLDNVKLNKNVHNITDKKFTSDILYKDFYFWINHHTNLPDCITKIYNLCVKSIYVILYIILFYWCILLLNLVFI
jgi:hypothetical protein